MATIDSSNAIENCFLELIADGGTLSAFPCLTNITFNANEDVDTAQCKGATNADQVKTGKASTIEVEAVYKNEDIQEEVLDKSVLGSNDLYDFRYGFVTGTGFKEYTGQCRVQNFSTNGDRAIQVLTGTLIINGEITGSVQV